MTNLGATLVSLQVPDRNGSMGEVVLGLPRAEDYLRHADSYFGATVGLFPNRIAGGRFSLDGREYQLDTNNAPGGIAICTEDNTVFTGSSGPSKTCNPTLCVFAITPPTVRRDAVTTTTAGA